MIPIPTNWIVIVTLIRYEIAYWTIGLLTCVPSKDTHRMFSDPRKTKQMQKYKVQ